MTIPLSNKVEDIFAGIKEISNVDAAEILSLHRKRKVGPSGSRKYMERAGFISFKKKIKCSSGFYMKIFWRRDV